MAAWLSLLLVFSADFGIKQFCSQEFILQNAKKTMSLHPSDILSRLAAIGILPGQHPRFVADLDSLLRALNERIAESLGPLNEDDKLFWSQFVTTHDPEIVSLILVDAIQLRTPLDFVVSVLRVSF